MLYGFKIIDDLCDGLSDWMDKKGYQSIKDFHRAAIPNTTDWQQLNMNYVRIAHINQENCIQCGRCFAACEDTAHQAIAISEQEGVRTFTVKADECVGCNLCQITCPEPDAIVMQDIAQGKPHLSWLHHPDNPFAKPEAD
jgi:dihydropyrimidine dehydrogenase (NAD+) subunit PreA